MFIVLKASDGPTMSSYGDCRSVNVCTKIAYQLYRATPSAKTLYFFRFCFVSLSLEALLSIQPKEEDNPHLNLAIL